MTSVNTLMGPDIELMPGTRVRIISASHVLKLRSDTGVVLRRDTWCTYYLVQLDQPALYDNSFVQAELQVIRVDAENLEVLDPTPGASAVPAAEVPPA